MVQLSWVEKNSGERERENGRARADTQVPKPLLIYHLHLRGWGERIRRGRRIVLFLFHCIRQFHVSWWSDGPVAFISQSQALAEDRRVMSLDPVTIVDSSVQAPRVSRWANIRHHLYLFYKRRRYSLQFSIKCVYRFVLPIYCPSPNTLLLPYIQRVYALP